MKNKIIILLIGVLYISTSLFSQDAKIELSLRLQDSVKYCTAKVTCADTAVKGVTMKFYAKRTFSLLAVAEGTTDDNGILESVFPNDIIGDSLGNVTVVAKITEDDNYGTVETSSVVKWGLKPKITDDISIERTLASSRGNAPIILIIVANTIIIGIWGTLFYIILQLFKIRRNSKKMS